HKGAAFVEILQNCNVFNDGAFNDVTDKATKADSTLVLEHGKPLVFGRNRDRGIRLRDFQPEAVELGGGITEADLLVHDERNPADPHGRARPSTLPRAASAPPASPGPGRATRASSPPPPPRRTLGALAYPPSRPRQRSPRAGSGGTVSTSFAKKSAM